MKYLLTNDLWKKIYEYDNTYHIINKLLIEELYLKTSFWKLKWINRKMDYVSRSNRISFRETTKNIFYSLIKLDNKKKNKNKNKTRRKLLKNNSKQKKTRKNKKYVE